MFGLTTLQQLSLTISILGFLAGAGTQMTDIFAPLGSIAPVIVKEIVSLAGFVSGILGIVLTTLSSQTKQVQAVQAMPGVESILVNAQANKTVAGLALDPAQPKIDIAPGAATAVQKTANQP